MGLGFREAPGKWEAMGIATVHGKRSLGHPALYWGKLAN